MSEIIRTSVISFLSGIILASLYFSYSLTDLLSTYLYGMILSISLTIVVLFVGAKNTQVKNITYNSKLKEGSKNHRDESILQIIKKRITIIPLSLIILGSWISSFYLLYQLIIAFLYKE